MCTYTVCSVHGSDAATLCDCRRAAGSATVRWRARAHRAVRLHRTCCTKCATTRDAVVVQKHASGSCPIVIARKMLIPPSRVSLLGMRARSALPAAVGFVVSERNESLATCTRVSLCCVRSQCTTYSARGGVRALVGLALAAGLNAREGSVALPHAAGSRPVHQVYCSTLPFCRDLNTRRAAASRICPLRTTRLPLLSRSCEAHRMAVRHVCLFFAVLHARTTNDTHRVAR